MYIYDLSIIPPNWSVCAAIFGEGCEVQVKIVAEDSFVSRNKDCSRLLLRTVEKAVDPPSMNTRNFGCIPSIEEGISKLSDLLIDGLSSLSESSEFPLLGQLSIIPPSLVQDSEADTTCVVTYIPSYAEGY